MKSILQKLFSSRKGLSQEQLIEKMLSESSNHNIQLEIIYKNKLILQIECLKYSESIFDNMGVDKNIYSEGFFISFFFEQKDLNQNRYYLNYLKNKDRLNITEFNNTNFNILDCLHFFVKNTTPRELNEYSKLVLKNIYEISDTSLEVSYNLRRVK